MLLAQRWTAWLVQFFVTWKKCERLGLIRPLWVSYEDDFLGDKHLLATRVAGFLGVDMAAAARLALSAGASAETWRLVLGQRDYCRWCAAGSPTRRGRRAAQRASFVTWIAVLVPSRADSGAGRG